MSNSINKSMFEPLSKIEQTASDLKCGIKALALLHSAMESVVAPEDGVEPLFYLVNHLFDEVSRLEKLTAEAFREAGYQA